MSKLHISERFLSFQGEGALIGEPTYFLRLAGCHLACVWCDTTEVWKVKRESLTPSELMADFRQSGLLDRFQARKATLTITGGSPILQDQALSTFLDALVAAVGPTIADSWLRIECDCSPRWIGSKVLSNHRHNGLYINASPKLSNSHVDGVLRNPLRMLQYVDATFRQRACYKFVVATEADADEALHLLTVAKLHREQCYYMPMAATRAAYQSISPLVATLALRDGVRFGPREHIAVYDQKTGV